MDEQKHTAGRLRIRQEQSDVFLVVTDDSEPEAIPVISTPIAQSYWMHPSHSHHAAAS